MLELWQKRLRQHQVQQFKYLRFVFNDHFVIAIIFLIGALALGYANGLKMIHQTFWWSPFLLGALYLVTLSIGHLATLFEAADNTFLLPKETDLFHYLIAARRYSLLLPTVVIILVNIAIFPFALVVQSHFSLANAIFIVIALLILKDTQLWLEFLDCYSGKVRLSKGYFYGISFLLLLLGIYTTSILSAVLALGLNLWLRRNITKDALEGQLQFDAIIQRETTRQFKILKIYNLFTDIPSLQRSAKRRKYLDWLLKVLPKSHRQAYLYLFGRGFLRGTEYIGFYLRFLFIGTIILFFVKQLWLAVVLYLLFLYLSGFQLLPFYEQYDTIVFTKLYPITNQNKLRSFQIFLTIVLVLQWVVTSIPLFVTFGLTLSTFGFVLLGFVFLLAFIFAYAKTRFNKIKV